MLSSDYENPVLARVRRLFSPVAEVLQLTTVYLGIAVAVTVAVSLTLPTARDQVRHAYIVLQSTLMPDNDAMAFQQRPGTASDRQDDSSPGAPSPVMKADELTWAKGATLAGSEGTVQGDTVDAPHLNFTQALVDSEGESAISGVTAAQAHALRSYISRKYKIAGNVTGALISTVFTVGRQMELDPQLLLAVIAIESRYNPYAESHMGAQGLMQVMTRVHQDKFASFGEGPLAAVHPLANIQVGAQILADCINRRGSLDGGLACYVGATGPSDGGYGAKVKAEWRRIALASGIPIQR